jgi:hypothetical protein
MRRFFIGAVSLVLALPLLSLTAHANPTSIDWSFQLIGDSGLCASSVACAISGPKGQPIGWGYQIHNSSDFWLVPFSLTPSVPFAFATESSYFDFPIVSPHSEVTVMFSPDAAGLYQLVWSDDIPGWFPSQTGVFRLSAEWFSADLFSDQCLSDLDACDAGGAGNHSAAFSASLTSETVAAAVPEPPSVALLIVAFGGLAMVLSSDALRRIPRLCPSLKSLKSDHHRTAIIWVRQARRVPLP